MLNYSEWESQKVLIKPFSSELVIIWIHEYDYSLYNPPHYDPVDANCSVFSIHKTDSNLSLRITKNGFSAIEPHHIFIDFQANYPTFVCIFARSGLIFFCTTFSMLRFVNADIVLFGKTSSFIFEKFKVVHY